MKSVLLPLPEPSCWQELLGMMCGGAKHVVEPNRCCHCQKLLVDKNFLVWCAVEPNMQWSQTGSSFTPHQILRLPRKINLMINPSHVWNVIYNARNNRHHPYTWPNAAPATQNECHAWSCSHMKRHLPCAEQQASPSHLTKHCACHAKWMSWLIVLTYETSFPMRRAARVTLQLHQILRLPRKMHVMIDPAHVWNVIYNAQSNRYHPATSPNTAPATQNCTPKS